MTRHIRLCADDFALDAACTHGILDLFARDRLSAASCLVESPLWPEAARAAREAGVHHSALGLHFNLTEGLSDDDLPLKKLLLASLAGNINPARVARRLAQQLDRFEQCWGCAPAHVDGHQHVHVLPGVREVVLDLLQQRYHQSLPRLRSIYPMAHATDSAWKRRLLMLLGSGFGKEAASLGFPLNNGFAGVYSLSAGADYPCLLANWLHHADEGMELMCHPANGTASSHAAARQQEYDYLASPVFADLMDCLNVEIATSRRPPAEAMGDISGCRAAPLDPG